jgi:hypothetical protein
MIPKAKQRFQYEEVAFLGGKPQIKVKGLVYSEAFSFDVVATLRRLAP